MWVFDGRRHSSVDVFPITDLGHYDRLLSPIDLKDHSKVAQTKSKALTSLELPDTWIPYVLRKVI